MKRVQWMTAVAAFLVAVNVNGQQMIRYIASGPTAPIAEVGVIFAEKDSRMVADLIMPEQALPKGYKPQGIQKDDQLVMANGVQLKSAKEFTDLYDKTEIGGTIKLGLKRGEEKMMVTFVKADPKDLPKRKKVIVGPDGKEKMEER